MVGVASLAPPRCKGCSSCWGSVRRLVAQHPGDGTERHAEFGVGGFVDLDRHFVGFAVDIGDHAVDAAGRDHAVVLLDVSQHRLPPGLLPPLGTDQQEIEQHENRHE